MPDSFGPEFFPTDRLQVEAEVRISGDKVLFGGQLTADLREACCRCLREFTRHLEVDFNETFILKDEIHFEDRPTALALEAANLQTVHGNYLYLEEYLRQVLLLARGYRSLCREDCQGICPVCGADLSSGPCNCVQGKGVDPRLKKLEEFSALKTTRNVRSDQ